MPGASAISLQTFLEKIPGIDASEEMKRIAAEKDANITRFNKNLLVRAVVAPGLWLQRLTTREPSDDQLEVALLALQKTLWRERAGAEVQGGGVEVFASYAEALPAIGSGQTADA